MIFYLEGTGWLAWELGNYKPVGVLRHKAACRRRVASSGWVSGIICGDQNMYRSTQYGLYIIGKYINLASLSIFGAIFLGKHGKFLWRRTFLKIRLLLDVAFDASFGNLKWVMSYDHK